MSPIRFFAFFLAAALPAFSKGINVRFLANPPGDSVTAYRVLRLQGSGEPVAVGQVSAASGRDTLSFADTGAARGLAYIYSIVAVNTDGEASDPSGPTEVGLPLLSLPDSLHAGAAGATWDLPPGADPLAGTAALSLVLVDSSRFSMRFDTAAGRLTFEPRGAAVPGWAVLRAVYYGKFADLDSVWIDFPSPVGIAPRVDAGASAAWTLPARWSPRMGPLRLGAPESGSGGIWLLLSPRGEIIAKVNLPKPGAQAFWDGRNSRGGTPAPSSYLWAVRGRNGAVLRAGSLRIDP